MGHTENFGQFRSKRYSRGTLGLQLAGLLVSVAFAAIPARAAVEESAESLGRSTKLRDGTWTVRRMTCGGEKANASTRALYTRGNSINVVVNGELGAFVDIIEGCRKEIPLRFSYPEAGTVTASFNGPIRCLPAECMPGCGLDLPLAVDYRFRQRPQTLHWESVGSVDDNCTRNGQADPIHYVMRRKWGAPAR